MNKKLIIVCVVLSFFILAEGIALGICFAVLHKNADNGKVYNLCDFEPYSKLSQVLNDDFVSQINYIDGNQLVDGKPFVIEITDREAVTKIHALFQNALVRKMQDQSGLYGGNLSSVEIYYKDGTVIRLPLGIFVYEGAYYEYYGSIYIQVKNIVKSVQN